MIDRNLTKEWHFNGPKLIGKWLLFRVIHPALRCLPRISRKRRILLLCNGTQMVEHLSSVWELFKDDRDLTFCLFLVYGDKRPGEAARVSHKLPVRQIGKLELYLRHWDLVITADHLFAGRSLTLINPFSWPTLRIPHGIPNKRVNGELYSFGKGCYDEKGRIRYTCMFVASEAERRMAIEMNPGFSEKVVVVGNLLSDKLLEMAQNRDEIRHRLGIRQNEILVLVLSTFGPHCLYNMMGDALLAELRRHSDQFRFALSVHPMEYLSKDAGKRNWGARLADLRSEGFLVLDSGEDWEPYMVASDVIVTDHTSLALYGAALGRPYVYAPVSETVVERNAPASQLLAISPILRPDASNLMDSLRQALNEYPLEKLKHLNEELNSFPGQAKTRARRAIHRLLY